MSKFLHKLAEGLRAREQYLEEHSAHPIFDTEQGSPFKEDYDALLDEVKDFSTHVADLAASGEDYDEHFEREISDKNEHLSIKIDTWAKGLKKE